MNLLSIRIDKTDMSSSYYHKISVKMWSFAHFFSLVHTAENLIMSKVKLRETWPLMLVSKWAAESFWQMVLLGAQCFMMHRCIIHHWNQTIANWTNFSTRHDGIKQLETSRLIINLTHYITAGLHCSTITTPNDSPPQTSRRFQNTDCSRNSYVLGNKYRLISLWLRNEGGMVGPVC